MTSRRARACASHVAALLVLAPALARGDETASARRAAAAREMNRPHTLAQGGVGFLTLPTAEVCPTSPDRCEKGETSISVGLHNTYRVNAFGIGAGITWASTLRGDPALCDGAPCDPGLDREHSRSYFLVEAQGRYYVYVGESWDYWLGVALGGVVVNDSWDVSADRNPYSDSAYVGPRAVTIATEGVALGIAGGAEWSFAENWSLAATLRYENWFLPEERERAPTLDAASLAGRVGMIDLALSIVYRLAL